MGHEELHKWRAWDLVVNVLLIGVILLTLASVAWSLDTQEAGCQQPAVTDQRSAEKP